jgi:two-component system NtrC family sensor kinase
MVTIARCLLTFTHNRLKIKLERVLEEMEKKKFKKELASIHRRDDFDRIRHVSYQIMQLALEGLLRVDFLHQASKILMEYSGSDSVGMWLKERGKFYRSEVTRSQIRPFYFEILPLEKDENGRIIPKLRENTWLDRLSQDIFIGRFDPSLPCFTTTGSFWTEDFERTLSHLPVMKNMSEKDRLSVDKNFHSLILIPVRIKEESLGLLQLKIRDKGSFVGEDVSFFEGVAQTLGIALVHRRAQVELRERVKELTCLYGIAKLEEREDISLEKIIQGIVEILPHAWLYPYIASARIVLDEKSFKTSLFREGGERQTANIVVEGQKRGSVEVVYSEEMPELDEGPFLKEERSLIDTVAREIALIIERRQVERDKERLQEQLRHADRLATIGQLSAGIAHELNEPISSILGFAQLIQKFPNSPEQVKKDNEKIMKASLHAREVVKKLMLFARQMPPQKTRVNLNQIIEESLYFLESRCAKENIKVARLLSKDLPNITADPAQMTQVLVNIIVNAIQAMPDGGQLTIQTNSTQKFVSLMVEDTGMGMEEKVLKQIFLPFFTTKDVGKGTGLGMSVVHGIVKSHGGTIHVHSHVGHGTKFEIQLPIAD